MNSAERYLAISPNMNYEALAGDEDLLLAARGGSHAAFAELQKIYSHRLYKRILSITRNREDAEDALQDTFLRAYLALPSFEGRSRFSSWLTRIGINSALMILRNAAPDPRRRSSSIWTSKVTALTWTFATRLSTRNNFTISNSVVTQSAVRSNGLIPNREPQSAFGLRMNFL